MVKTLVFARLNLTSINLTSWIRCANRELKPDGDEVNN